MVRSGEMWAGKWRITFWIKTHNRTLTIYYVFSSKTKRRNGAHWTKLDTCLAL